MKTTFDHGGNVFSVARSLGIKPEDIADFSASINPLGISTAVKEALISSFDRYTHYPDSDAVELSSGLAAFHGLDRNSVCVANGSTELIYLMPRFLKGRRALVIAPAFSEYARALDRAGWDVAYLELDAENGFSLSVPLLEEKLSGGFDALFLCNPGNPTGKMLPLGTIKVVYRLCRASGTFLVLDEAFMDFCEAESAKHLLLDGGGVVLRSMTKFFAIPGLRLGYAMGSPEIIPELVSLREPWSVNTPAQIAGLAAIADTDYRLRTLQTIAEERALLAAQLATLNGLTVYPSAANYLLVRLDEGPTAAELRQRLLARGLLIRDCSNFQGLDTRFFRVAVRRRRENELLVREMEKTLGDAGKLV
ncbi:L-threonine-O-3-phosphate decarboxylase [Geotalea daltonii FRC-32]|uniref:threonine-phosphate decarboxylase n=1 Tax=Geotalea daltonii (strain DSM 22248 / JCM 15807 / FRC-32) TaxID=316067 RepID=B9M7V9_GEODF|nr:threonine-phosphate decarboxylase CobD [Geotalea daltonii]ACM18417.1 L-threonine-O-3-phosphate decarboxylase [Geotalea daltonii FRC-32]